MKKIIFSLLIVITVNEMVNGQNWHGNNYAVSYVSDPYTSNYSVNGWSNSGGGTSNYNYLRNWSKQVLRNNSYAIKQMVRYYRGNRYVALYVNEAINHQLYAKHLWRMGYFEDAVSQSNFAAEISDDLMNPCGNMNYDNEGDMYSPGLRKGKSTASNVNQRTNNLSKNVNSNVPVNEKVREKLNDNRLKIPADFNEKSQSQNRNKAPDLMLEEE